MLSKIVIALFAVASQSYAAAGMSFLLYEHQFNIGFLIYIRAVANEASPIIMVDSELTKGLPIKGRIIEHVCIVRLKF